MPEPEAKPPDLPSSDRWSRLGLRLTDEMHAGHQSRVFRAESEAGPIVVKLTDRRLADAFHGQRVELAARLAESCRAVVGPVALGSDLVIGLGEWLVVAYPEVGCPPPDDRSPAAVETMAVTLADVHRALAALERTPGRSRMDLPPVASLRDGQEPALLGRQVIHGDYAAANLIDSPAGLRVIDLDDCGRGSIEFDVGNSLYMALFDGWSSDDDVHYRRFRDRFVNAYGDHSGHQLDDELLDLAIRRRLAALRGWLDEPASAPIGLRSISPAWRRHLRLFLTVAAP